MQRYGVFSRAQIWMVWEPDGRASGYPDRASAVSAALARAGEAGGCEVLLQDETGYVAHLDQNGVRRAGGLAPALD